MSTTRSSSQSRLLRCPSNGTTAFSTDPCAQHMCCMQTRHMATQAAICWAAKRACHYTPLTAKQHCWDHGRCYEGHMHHAMMGRCGAAQKRGCAGGGGEPKCINICCWEGQDAVPVAALRDGRGQWHCARQARRKKQIQHGAVAGFEKNV